MNNIKKISIAMCTFNGEAYLKKQLESIAQQTFQPTELIICDDHSTDSTLEILNTFKNTCHFPVKIIVNTGTLRVTKNYENAIKLSTSEIIAFSDQDDIWKPDKLEKIINTFVDNPECGYVFSNADLINENGTLIGMDLWDSIRFNKTLLEKYKNNNQLAIMLKQGNFIYGMTMAFRCKFKSILLPIDTQGIHFTHDTWIALILSAIGAYGVAIPEPLVRYRQHQKQVVGAGKRNKLDSFARMNENRRIENMALADTMENIVTRLTTKAQTSNQIEYAKNLLRNKSIHFRARISANTSKGLQRFKIIYQEAISGRYFQFSNGFKSIAKDLIMGMHN